jgi:hypothetical protein
MEPLSSNCRRLAPAKEPWLVELFLVAANAACTSSSPAQMDCLSKSLREAPIGGML